MADRLDRSSYELTFEDSFRAELDTSRWLPYHLPQWSSRAQSAARFTTGADGLRLRIEADQEPWCPDLDGTTRVSNLQTGVFSGPVGSTSGQHRFHPEAVVREEQPEQRLYTPHLGLIELSARATDDPDAMVALWLIGFEDEPHRAGEICVAEIFGRDVTEDGARVGMGVHPFGDPSLVDDFAQVPLDLDARELHTYSAEWTPDQVRFYVDDEPVRVVEQSPAYPMQLMLGIYDFSEPGSSAAYPKEFPVQAVRGWTPMASS